MFLSLLNINLLDGMSDEERMCNLSRSSSGSLREKRTYHLVFLKGCARALSSAVKVE